MGSGRRVRAGGGGREERVDGVGGKPGLRQPREATRRGVRAPHVLWTSRPPSEARTAVGDAAQPTLSTPGQPAPPTGTRPGTDHTSHMVERSRDGDGRFQARRQSHVGCRRGASSGGCARGPWWGSRARSSACTCKKPPGGHGAKVACVGDDQPRSMWFDQADAPIHHRHQRWSAFEPHGDAPLAPPRPGPATRAPLFRGGRGRRALCRRTPDHDGRAIARRRSKSASHIVSQPRPSRRSRSPPRAW